MLSRLKAWARDFRTPKSRYAQDLYDMKKAVLAISYYEAHKDQLPVSANFKEDFAFEKEVNRIAFLNLSYIMPEFYRGIFPQIKKSLEYVDQIGGLHPYPPRIEKLRGPGEKIQKENKLKRIQEAADKEMRDKLTLDLYKEGNLLPHPDGFSLQIRKSKIDHPESGYGVFVHGHIIPGTFVAFYPGTIHSYKTLSPEISQGNEYLISREHPWIVDGDDWEQQAFLQLKDSKTLEYAGMDISSAQLACMRNPFGIGNYINHPPPGTQPNVISMPFNFTTNVDSLQLPEHLKKWIPNKRYAEERLLRSINSNVWMESVILLANTHIKNEELFLNYRFNPRNPYPSWYSPPDTKESERRWSKIWFGRSFR